MRSRVHHFVCRVSPSQRGAPARPYARVAPSALGTQAGEPPIQEAVAQSDEVMVYRPTDPQIPRESRRPWMTLWLPVYILDAVKQYRSISHVKFEKMVSMRDEAPAK